MGRALGAGGGGGGLRSRRTSGPHTGRPASGQTSPTGRLLITMHSPGPEIHVSDCALRSLSSKGRGERPEAITILCSQGARPGLEVP